MKLIEPFILFISLIRENFILSVIILSIYLMLTYILIYYFNLWNGKTILQSLKNAIIAPILSIIGIIIMLFLIWVVYLPFSLNILK